MKRSHIIFGLLVLFNCVNSQNYVDILKISGSTTPENTFDSSTTKTKVDQMEVDLTAPIQLSKNRSLITGVIFEQFQTKLFDYDHTKTFGSTTIKLGINKEFNPRWSGTLVLLPKISSDYKAFGSKDFQLGAIGIMKYKKNDNLTYKYGLYTNSELFGPFFVPMFGLYYLSPNKKFETNLMLPLQADVNYKILPFMHVGFNFNGQIRSYHLNDVTSQYHSTYLARSTNEFFGYLKFNLSNSVSLQTKVGTSVARSFKVYDENDKVNFGLPAMFFGPKRHQLNSNFSNGLIFQATLLYRFNLNKK